MTKFKLRAFLISAVTSTSLVFATVAGVTVVLTPDAAFAKSDNGKGKGQGKGKGKGVGNSNASNGAKADKNKTTRVSSNRNFKLKNSRARSSTTGKAKKGTVQRFSLSGLGREFKRDVEQLFGKRSHTKTKRNATKAPRKTYSKASIAPIKQSPRPVTRSVKRYSSYDKKKHSKHYYRDPLIEAITDPYGSYQLRNLNASKAAAPAFRNAAPNSNVGKIATYQAAANDYYGLRSDLYDARRDLRDLNENYDGRSSKEIADEISELDPNDPGYEERLGDLEKELQGAESYEVARDSLREDIGNLRSDTGTALYEAEAAFFDASKGRTLTRNSLGDFHSNLGLPQPQKPYQDEVTIQPLGYDPNYHQYTTDQKFRPTETDDQLRYQSEEPTNSKSGKHRYDDPLTKSISSPYGSDNLRNLNASKAAPSAFRNAAPNSNVGKIPKYQAAANDYYDLRSDLYDARRDLRDLNDRYDGRSSDQVAEDITDLDPSDPNYDEKLSTLEKELRAAATYEKTRDDLREDVKYLRVDTLVAQKQAERAFFDASKDTTLTPVALAELLKVLELSSGTE